jgi:hypothetical protein
MTVHLVTIKSFENEFKANLAIARLSQFGILAFIDMTNDVLVQPSTTISNGVDLKIEAHFVDEATRILEEAEI